MAASQSPILPPVMIGWTFSRGPYQKVLKLSKNIPTPPPPSKSNILIRVSYAALNPAGPLMISLLPSFILPKYPIPELDFSGTIVQTGPLVAARFKPNTKVFGCLIPVKTVLSGKGTLAEYIVVNEKISGISVVPENVPMDGAAGLGSVGQTAVKTCQRAGIKEGDKVLVNGASGGVGTMLVQVARAMGASVVVGICSGKNVEFVKEVGADEAVDYRGSQPVEDVLEKKYKDTPFDAILDAVGSQSLYENSPRYLKKQGIFVNVGALDASVPRAIWRWFKNTWWPSYLGGVPRKYYMFSTVFDQETSEILARFAAEGKVKTFVTETFDMEDLVKGYDVIVSKRARGKIVVKIGENLGGASG